MIKDLFDRVHDYLRISLTDNCNLRCFYCMPEEDHDFTPSSRLMQPDEINLIARLFVEQGVKKNPAYRGRTPGTKGCFPDHRIHGRFAGETGDDFQRDPGA
ncbi:MAG TPA: hypothetical protein VFC34_08920 [Puia sp.]|nr:hypothetical protein [Puia sp.]